LWFCIDLLNALRLPEPKHILTGSSLIYANPTGAYCLGVLPGLSVMAARSDAAIE